MPNKNLFWALSVLLLVAVYYFFNPAQYNFFPKCPFHYLTGLDCPGCGSQRAVFCLLHLDWKGAVRQNLLLVVSLPFLSIHAGYKLVSLIYGKNYQWPLIYHPVTPVVIAVITVTFWVIRNLPVYPFSH